MRQRNRKPRANPVHIAIILMLAIVIISLLSICQNGSASGEEQAVLESLPDQKIIDDQELTQLVATDMATEPVSDMMIHSDAERETVPARWVVERYAEIEISDAEMKELAAIVYLEAGNQCADGQQAVVEVILNRVVADNFPDTVHDVLHQGENSNVPQFSTIFYIDTAEPGEAQYTAIDAALYGQTILPEDVVYFSCYGENDRVWGEIGDHIFCRQYIWE